LRDEPWRDLIQRDGPLSPERATGGDKLRAARALCGPRERVIHRDVKAREYSPCRRPGGQAALPGIREGSGDDHHDPGGLRDGQWFTSSPGAGFKPQTQSSLTPPRGELYEMLIWEVPTTQRDAGTGINEACWRSVLRPPKEANAQVPIIDAVTTRLGSASGDHTRDASGSGSRPRARSGWPAPAEGDHEGEVQIG